MNAYYFDEREFRCPCCRTCCTIDKALLIGLDYVRHRLGVPVLVTSGYRCRSHNIEVGGSFDSYHMRGMAADVTTVHRDQLPLLVDAVQEVPWFRGIGVYEGHVHVDTRHTTCRWLWHSE